MAIEGWIKINRKIYEHWIWKDANKLKWWIDMLLIVNYKDNIINIGNELFECKRGQSIMSLQQWATRWNVDKNKVRNFFILLEKDGIILHENLSKTTRITICKYETYQEVENAIKTQSKRKANAIKTQTDPIKESKERKEGKESKESIQIKNKYGEFENVFLTDLEHQKAQEKYKELLPEMIQKLSSFIATKGKDPYVSHYATFSSWVYNSILEDNKKNGNNNSNKNANGPQWANGGTNGLQRQSGKQPYVFSGAEFSAKVQERLKAKGIGD